MDEVFIIAEIGNAHEGSVGLAKCFIKAAADCGVNAVKFQTHMFGAESLPDAPNPSYFKDETRKEYFERTAFNLTQWRELKRYTEEKCGIEFMSSVFSMEAVDLLEEIDVRRYKIPSGEVTNFPLLEKVANTKKPVLLSSGMSAWHELDGAMNVLKLNGCENITILQCTSIYPCPLEKIGLNVLLELKDRYNFPVGLSDHTLGFSASIAAVALGAKVIEKHVTLSRRMYGSDVKHSLEPDDFKLLVKEIRDMEKAVSSEVDKDKLAKELKEIKITFEKSIVAKRNIPRGTTISFDMIAFRKPGDGVRADKYREIVGRVAKVNIVTNTKIREEMLQ